MYRPVSQTIASLKRAATVLDQIMAGDRVDELAEEFFAFWPGKYCYSDIENRGSSKIEMLWFGRGQWGVLTDNKVRTIAKFSRIFGGLSPDRDAASTIRTKISPRPAFGEWPPKTLCQMLDWQSKLDPPCRRKILKLVVQAYRAGLAQVFIMIDAPTMQYGFFVKGLQKHKRVSRSDQRTPVFEALIKGVNVVRMDDRYIVERNIPGHSTLAGKKIALAGCGTIGGYLADLLVRAGAGSSGGELVLIDNQPLAPGNIGRHRLGMNRLESNKATGLRSELLTTMPSASVVAIPDDACSVNFSGFDLVIDATGEQGFGNWLAGQQAVGCILKNGERTPLLHVWIDGAGEAVRTLFKRHNSEGCYRCLCDYERDHLFLSVQGGVQRILSGGGCEGRFVAYPASVSVQAAALALDSALAWVNATPWPQLSTRVLSQSQQAMDGDLTMLPRRGCPACNS
jgi:molybdopterin/thiamine biosynthesis adenylyltransferase